MDREDDFSDRTLPEGYYGEGATTGVDLQGQRLALEGLTYEEDAMSVVGDDENQRLLALPAPPLDNFATTRRMAYQVTRLAPEPLLGVVREPTLLQVHDESQGPTVTTHQVHDQSTTRQEVHHHYGDVAAQQMAVQRLAEERVERLRQQEQIQAQAMELSRRERLEEKMHSAGTLLQQQLEDMRKANKLRSQEAERAAEHVRKLQADQAAAQERQRQLEIQLQQMTKLDLERQLSRERERTQWQQSVWMKPEASSAPVGRPELPVPTPSPTLLSGFSAPKAPRYSGSTLDARKAFASQYHEYVSDCAQVALATGCRIGIRPIGTCIEAKAKRFAAEMHMGKDVQAVKNHEWEAYFQYAFDYHGQDYGDLEQAIRSHVIMDDKELDAERCHDKWIHSYWLLLERNNMQSFHKRHPKNAVKALIEGIRPASLKAVVKSHLDLDQKHLRNDVLQFFAYVKTKLIAQNEFTRAAKASGLVKTEDKARNEDSQPKNPKAKAIKKPFDRKSAPPPVATPVVPSKGVECWSCKGSHRIQDCVETSEAEKTAIIEKKRNEWSEARKAKRAQAKALRQLAPNPSDGSVWASIPGVDLQEPVQALIDSGSDAVMVISSGLVNLLTQTMTQDLQLMTLEEPTMMEGFGLRPVALSQHLVLPVVELTIDDARLTLRNVSAWVDPNDHGLAFTLGRPIMTALGYSTESLIRGASMKQGDIDLSGLSVLDQDASAVAKALRARYAQLLSEGGEQLALDKEEDDDLPVEDPVAKVKEVLRVKILEASEQGLSTHGTKILEAILMEHSDVFRVQFQDDPPIHVAPLEVRLKPDAIPTMCKQRRYSPLHTDFLRSHLAEIVGYKLGRVNGRSRWASPPRIVSKSNPKDPFRMTVDTRGPNSMTEPMLWPMPVLEVVMARLKAAKVFFCIDWFKGFWQLPLHENSREMYTIMGIDEMVESNRVLMGQTDAVAFCQKTAQEVYGEKYGHGMEAWLDDGLGHAEDEEKLLDLLAWLFKRCLLYGLKLNPNKCDFFAKEVIWCGKRISGEGISHDPKRLAGLVELPAPRNAQELQQFVCAFNWMRQHVPNYSELVAPLTKLLDEVCQVSETRKKNRLGKYQLVDFGWSQTHDEAYSKCKEALANMATLAHPDADKDFHLYTDASQDHWGAVLTQVTRPTELDSADTVRPEDQDHQPLAFLSGTYKGASLRWSTTEKEAFAIVAACKRLDYLLQRPGGFTIHTDHRNLRFIFGTEPEPNQPRYLADKLARWSVVLASFTYKIVHVAGEDNVWGDLLSRWGNKAAQPDAAIWADTTGNAHVVPRIRQLVMLPMTLQSPLSEDFEWPTMDTIKQAQSTFPWNTLEKKKARNVSVGADGVTRQSDRIWIPQGALDLQLSLLVVAHAGAMGHRGGSATCQALKDHFVWMGMDNDVKAFVSNCLQCMCVAGEMVPTPLGEALHAVGPNQLIHCDFLSMPGGYVHVIVDDASRFCQLTWHDRCRAQESVEAMQQWFAYFGVVTDWMSDQGPHYKNQVVEGLRKIYGAQHSFSPAHCPWANGTVEVMMRSVQKTVRTMLLELKMPQSEVASLLPLVMHALNQTPSAANGNLTPVQGMTQLAPSNALNAIMSKGKVKEVDQATLEKWRASIWSELATARDQLHRDMVVAGAVKRDKERDRHNAKRGVKQRYLARGDYVLCGRIQGSHAPKLQIRWLGPRRIVTVLTDWLFDVEDLRDGRISRHHASRLKLFAAKDLEVTQDLLDHVAYVEGGYIVEELRDLKFDPKTKTWVIQVKWAGLDELENTWEPAVSLNEDVPAMVRTFLGKDASAHKEGKKRARAFANREKCASDLNL